MNQIVVSGRVSKEISVKGKVGFFTLANDRDYPFNKDQNGNKISNFFTVKVIGEKAIANVQKMLSKGTAVIISGHYYRDSWKAGNEYKEFNYILLSSWEYQTGKITDNTPVGYTEEQAASDTHTEENNHYVDANDISSDDIDIDSLPFR